MNGDPRIFHISIFQKRFTTGIAIGHEKLYPNLFRDYKVHLLLLCDFIYLVKHLLGYLECFMSDFDYFDSLIAEKNIKVIERII